MLVDVQYIRCVLAVFSFSTFLFYTYVFFLHILTKKTSLSLYSGARYHCGFLTQTWCRKFSACGWTSVFPLYMWAPCLSRLNDSTNVCCLLAAVCGLLRSRASHNEHFSSSAAFACLRCWNKSAVVCSRSDTTTSDETLPFWERSLGLLPCCCVCSSVGSKCGAERTVNYGSKSFFKTPPV